MALRTPQEYLQSLRDDRVVYFEGERVQDVTEHGLLGVAARACALDYSIAMDPQYRHLFVAKDESGEEVSTVFTPARSAADLTRAREIVQLLARIRLGQPGGAKFTGVDALHALTVAAGIVDRTTGSDYSRRVEEYRKYLMRNDLAIVACMTDVKGNRSLRPSAQQPHRDFYVRIVDESKEGIIVRGAKMHISHAPCANEMIVMPCRAMGAEDKDYAVVFAIPVNTKGVKLFNDAESTVELDDYFNYPISASMYSASGLVVFDDVFVPAERVFLKREWQHSARFTHLFANFHRLTADSYTYAELEVIVGLAALLAEYNGLEKASHVVDKLAWLMVYAETVEALGRAAAVYCVCEPDTDLVYPNPMYSNVAKFHYADHFHEAVKLVQDIGGGLVANTPSSHSYSNPEIRPYFDKYFRGKNGVPAEHRLRAMHLAKDLTSAWKTTATIHGEGSLATQRLSVYAQGDWARYKAAARRAARIDDGSEHPLFSHLPDFPVALEE